MIDALASWLADLVIAALGALPDWNPSVPSFPFLSQLADINWFVNIVPAFAITIAAAALGPMFLVGTVALWGYGLVRGGGNRA